MFVITENIMKRPVFPGTQGLYSVPIEFYHYVFVFCLIIRHRNLTKNEISNCLET